MVLNGKEVTPNSPLKLHMCSTALLLNIICVPSPSSRGPSPAPLGLVFVILRAHALLPFHMTQKRREAAFPLGLPSMKDSAKLTSEEETGIAQRYKH